MIRAVHIQGSFHTLVYITMDVCKLQNLSISIWPNLRERASRVPFKSSLGLSLRARSSLEYLDEGDSDSGSDSDSNPILKFAYAATGLAAQLCPGRPDRDQTGCNIISCAMFGRLYSYFSGI